MKNSFEDMANNFLASDGGKKINSKKKEIENLASSADGQKVKSMLEGRGDLERALENGDMETIRRAIGSIMNTDSGARLIKNLGDLMK